MENDRPYNVVGIGLVKMHDNVVIAEVRHVSDMSKNPISLTILDLGGCKFIFNDGVLKIVKGALIMKKVRHIGRLYDSRLLGAINISVS